MPYLTIDELYARKGGPDRVVRLAGGEPTDALRRIEQAKATAEAEARSYLEARFGTLLDSWTVETTPAVLKDKVATATLYHLVENTHDQIAQPLVDAYLLILEWYRAVAAGRADLPVDSVPEPSTSTGTGIAISGAARVFGDGGLDGMVPSFPARRSSW